MMTDMQMRRRDFLRAAALAGAGVLVARTAFAQQGAQVQDTMPHDTAAAGPASGQTSNLFDMDQDAAKRVTRPPKRDAVASMTPDQRDALERQIRCQCGCTLDVYICRTTDFSCQVSPAMHRDVMALVDGGYSAQEILDAFVQTYGERALMAPKKEGFNWAGYIVPFAVLGAGAAGLVAVLRRMRERTALVTAATPASVNSSATDDEMARLRAAVRRDD